MSKFEEWFKNNYIYMNVVLLLSIAVLIILLIFAVLKTSNENDRLAPPEAIQACNEKKPNDVCEFLDLRSNIDTYGTCQNDKGVLSCRPLLAPAY